MELSDILSEDAVLLCQGIKTKTELLEKLSAQAALLTGLAPDAVLNGIMEREQLGSTGLGSGIAIPHGKLSGVSTVRAVFARLDTPIDYAALDDQPVDIVMLLLAPLGAGADHLKALARVARLLRREQVVEQLRNAASREEALALLTGSPATNAAA